MSKTTESGNKMLKTAKRMFFKGEGSRDALFSRLWERLKLFRTSQMSGYHIEPIGDNQVFKGAVRNIENGKKGKMGIFKGDNSLDALFFEVM